ncbi:phosphatase PAP2 family protein [Nocardia sp. NBC_00508]|uniref:phosphatase PAP2 family protein n=1 Tax=Nocardia sp. NBC_00508 TaxID=2975992 RepID=UPI002E81BE24|nr:phosphatase PAP2 family protein [Nocardia sp. NBC_00508]WUD65925.1 phosphatase PAP2 family protein [Nocardia sp. NBC_00508]
MSGPGAGRAQTNRQSPTRRVARDAVWSGYLVGLVATIYTAGLPTSRAYQAVWILAGIAAFTIDRPWRNHLRILADWLPLLGALVLYDYTRGFADELGMPLRMTELAAVERGLFNGTIPTVWLQQRLAADGQPWWTPVTGAVYSTHFIVPWLLAAIFYVRSRPLWARYMRRILILSYLGLATYILLPAAPPWYASREGVITEGVDRIAGFGFGMIPIDTSTQWLEAQGNHVAALPSLHTAFALLVTVTLWPLLTNSWLRAVLAIFPLSMTFTLVYGGEHYMVDVLSGWAYAVLTIMLAVAWERRSRRASTVHNATGSDGALSVSEPTMHTVSPESPD